MTLAARVTRCCDRMTEIRGPAVAVTIPTRISTTVSSSSENPERRRRHGTLDLPKRTWEKSATVMFESRLKESVAIDKKGQHRQARRNLQGGHQNPCGRCHGKHVRRGAG